MRNIDKYEKDLKALMDKGLQLQWGLFKQLGLIEQALLENPNMEKVDPIDFNMKYQGWYTEALAIILQILPSRKDDFIELYKNDKRKDLDYLTYTISDALLGVVVRLHGIIQVDPSAALPKFQQQMTILEGLENRFKSSLFEISQLVQADLFDSEIDVAKELLRTGFLRPAGVVCGVVIEKHLGQICINHNININKKHPTIADFNEALKSANIIEVGTWRQIQYLADIRNLCGHNKDKEPSEDEVEGLISGTDKIIKPVY